MQPDTEAAVTSTRIHQKLDDLGEEETKFHIYRVYDHLRNQNPSAYEPQILAIGPYHHGKPNTKQMEKLKLLYLKSLLQDRSVDPYVLAIDEIKQEALSCYADSMENFIRDKFIEIMLLDGCFIIELLRKYCDNYWQEGDPIFETEWIMGSVTRDLMLFENQIPFFVLWKLFRLVDAPFSNYRTLLVCIFRFFEGIIPGAEYRIPPDSKMPNTDGIKHLLHLLHIFWSPDSLDTSHQKPVDEKQWRFLSAVTKLIWSPASLDKSHKKPMYPKSWQFVSAVTKLRDANVEFEENDKGASLFNVTFKNGTLKLSHLQIVDRTETIFRNLIAYEQYFPRHNFATDYVTFLDRIIDSPEDVEILCQHGILENWLGSHKVVSDFFNKLTDSVTLGNNFIYAGVCEDVNKHCKKRRNKWMAMLRKNHLSNPWAILSLIAAVVLLLLTAVQTVCSVLQA